MKQFVRRTAGWFLWSLACMYLWMLIFEFWGANGEAGVLIGFLWAVVVGNILTHRRSMRRTNR